MAFASAAVHTVTCSTSASTSTSTSTCESSPVRVKVSRRQALRTAALAAAAATSGAGVRPTPAPAQAAAKPDFIKDESGLLYYDVNKGTGAQPVDGDYVAIDFVAYLSNGTVFDNRKNLVFQLGKRQVVPGLEVAVATMRPGGERRAVFPPALAYGEKGVCLPSKECLVPPNETLGYSITLLRVAVPPT